MKRSLQRYTWVLSTGFLAVVLARGASPEPTVGTDDRLIVLTSHAIREAALVHLEPEYPATARQFRLTAEVVAEFTVGFDGKVEQVTITKGHPMFNSAVISAVKRWSFAPFMVEGHPRKIKSTLTFDFKL
jgi:TonB family protein